MAQTSYLQPMGRQDEATRDGGLASYVAWDYYLVTNSSRGPALAMQGSWGSGQSAYGSWGMLPHSSRVANSAVKMASLAIVCFGTAQAVAANITRALDDRKWQSHRISSSHSRSFSSITHVPGRCGPNGVGCSTVRHGEPAEQDP